MYFNYKYKTRENRQLLMSLHFKRKIIGVPGKYGNKIKNYFPFQKTTRFFAFENNTAKQLKDWYSLKNFCLQYWGLKLRPSQ